MVVVNDSATAGEKELKTDWPIIEGTTLGTTKLSKKYLLEPQEKDLVEHWGSI